MEPIRLTHAKFHKMSIKRRNRFSGIVYDKLAGLEIYILDGQIDRELGPAIIRNGVKCHYINGYYYDEKEYWLEMLNKHKGTDKEPLILSKILGSD